MFYNSPRPKEEPEKPAGFIFNIDKLQNWFVKPIGVLTIGLMIYGPLKKDLEAMEKSESQNRINYSDIVKSLENNSESNQNFSDVMSNKTIELKIQIDINNISQIDSLITELKQVANINESRNYKLNRLNPKLLNMK